MAAIKPSVPKGTRDFSPAEMVKRNFIFDTIKGVFRKYGYQQIETPSMENLSTLTGKYGDEGDKLMFKILNSGSYLGDYNLNLDVSVGELPQLSITPIIKNTIGIQIHLKSRTASVHSFLKSTLNCFIFSPLS